MIVKLLFSGLILLTLVGKTTDTQTLILEVENIESAQGYIWFGIYDSKQNFLDEEKAIMIFGEKVNVKGKIEVKTDKIPFGMYAIAVFHDVNNNGKLDQNFVGIPQEPYAFSDRLKSKWRAPVFDDVKFTFNRANQKLRLRLENW